MRRPARFTDGRAPHDELAFRRPSASAETWVGQLRHIQSAADWPHVVVQVLPFSAGVHQLMGKGSLTLLWQADGSAVAYTEGDSSGLLMDDPEDALRYSLSYDRLRDLALTPSDSLTFIRDVLEDHRPRTVPPTSAAPIGASRATATGETTTA